MTTVQTILGAFASPVTSPLALVGWLVLALLAPGLLALVAVVVAFLVRPGADGPGRDGPGYYHVLEFDPATGAPRDATVHAADRDEAKRTAESDGWVVSEVTRVVDEG